MNRPLKILLINNGKGWSGGQEHLKDLAVELRSTGSEVQFLVRGGTVNEPRFSELGFKVHLMPYGHGWENIKAFRDLLSTLRRERFDVVSINREHDLVPMALAYRFAFPFERSGRLMMSYHLPTERRQFLLGLTDAVVCISEHVKTKLLDSNPCASRKTHVLYYGIDPGIAPSEERYSSSRGRRFFHGRDFPVIGMVGEFWKNQMDLVEMVPRLKKVFPNITIAFIGNDKDPRLVDPLVARIRELGVEENIVFTGLVPRNRLPDLFHDMDLSVSTHRNEGFGIVHLESLAAGTPVVGYNEGGYVDIFKGEDAGVLVDGGKEEFASTVIELLEDHERRFAMGRAGRDLVERKYSIRTMGESYVGFYRRLVGA